MKTEEDKRLMAVLAFNQFLLEAGTEAGLDALRFAMQSAAYTTDRTAHDQIDHGRIATCRQFISKLTIYFPWDADKPKREARAKWLASEQSASVEAPEVIK